MNDPTINYVGSWTANLTSFQIIESIAAELGATLTFAFNGISFSPSAWHSLIHGHIKVLRLK